MPPMPSRRPATLDARRRLAAALVAFPALWAAGAVQAQAAGRLRPTPAQTEGPFYPVQIPRDHDNDLLRNGDLRAAGGRPGWVEGTLRDVDGRPLADAAVEIWQCDEAGHYHHPGDGGHADPGFQGFGRTLADSEGRWRFRTMAPVPYPGRTPHIHLKVRSGERELLTTQLYMAGAPGNARDFLWRNLSEADRAALTLAFEPAGNEEWRASFPVVVART